MGVPKAKPGTVIAGRYKLVAPLSRGGMGSVWRAEHLALGIPIAVKLIDASLVEHDEPRARFEQEARAAAALRSPNVVQILDHGVDRDLPFIAMELLDGESLSQRLHRLGTVPPVQIARIFQDVARAMRRAHEMGIVHRDLKPDNIFLVRNDDQEIAKVLDFGIAKAREPFGDWSGTSTRTGALIGTPQYMSPEQAQGMPVDAATDLWALGVIAFECVCGRHPFPSEKPGELILQICVRPIPIPSVVARVPPRFDAWFARACHREANGRFANAKELADTLAEALGLGAPSADRSGGFAPLASPNAVAIAMSPVAVSPPAAPAGPVGQMGPAGPVAAAPLVDPAAVHVARTPSGTQLGAGAPVGGSPVGGNPAGASPMGASPMGASPMGASPMGASPAPGGAPQFGGAPRLGGAPQYGAPPVGGAPPYGAPPQGGAPQYGAPPPGGAPQYGAPPLGGKPAPGAAPPQGGQYPPGGVAAAGTQLSGQLPSDPRLATMSGGAVMDSDPSTLMLLSGSRSKKTVIAAVAGALVVLAAGILWVVTRGPTGTVPAADSTLPAPPAVTQPAPPATVTPAEPAPTAEPTPPATADPVPSASSTGSAAASQGATSGSRQAGNAQGKPTSAANAGTRNSAAPHTTAHPTSTATNNRIGF